MQVKLKHLEDVTYYIKHSDGGWTFINGVLLRGILLRTGCSEEDVITVVGEFVGFDEEENMVFRAKADNV